MKKNEMLEQDGKTMRTQNTNKITPTLDIIMPVYNTSLYLEQCIHSIINQTFTNWHLFIIDDGSTDSSPEICDQWAERDTRITVIHKQNSGQGESRNVAIRQSKADFVGFVDSDDWLEPDMYKFLIDSIQQHDADIAVCGHYNEFTDRSICKHTDYSVEVLDYDTVHQRIIRDNIQSYIWQMVFRRKCIERHMPGHLCYEDYAVLPQWFKNVRRVVHTRRPFYHYRMRLSSLVHIITPEQEYAFLEAEEQRYKFYQNTPFKNQINIHMAIICIRVAKYITRLNISQDTIMEFLERIKQRLAKIDSKYRLTLSRKNRMLRYLLLYHTSLFIFYQKTEIKLMKKKRKNDTNTMFK